MNTNTHTSDGELEQQILSIAERVLIAGEMPEFGSKAEYLKSSQNSVLVDPTSFRRYLAHNIADKLTPIIESYAERRATTRELHRLTVLRATPEIDWIDEVDARIAELTAPLTKEQGESQTDEQDYIIFELATGLPKEACSPEQMYQLKRTYTYKKAKEALRRYSHHQTEQVLERLKKVFNDAHIDKAIDAELERLKEQSLPTNNNKGESNV